MYKTKRKICILSNSPHFNVGITVISTLSILLVLLFTGCSTVTRLASTTTTTSTTTTSTSTSTTSTTATSLSTSTTTTSTTTTSTTTTSTTTTTTVGAYVGAYVHGINNTPAFETAIGQNLAVNQFYISWITAFPSADCDSIYNYGGAPIITWEPFLSTTNTLDAISNGNYDSYITTFAQAAKNWGRLIYLRFGHEMNGNWYPWDGAHNGGSAGAGKYIAAWRHIYNIFTSAGATNVKFIWSVNHINTPADSWNNSTNYYPGDTYVDWIGFDGYNWGDTQSWSDWQTFSQVFNSVYTTYSSYNKPLMLSEFASTTTEGSTTKAAWITDAMTKLQSDYPKIKMFVWFNENKECDWRAESSADSLAAFQNAVSNSYFSGNRPIE